MRADNPLTREYLLSYPGDAARILEQVSAEHVAALFNELPLKTSAAVMVTMLPGTVTHCLQAMNAATAAKLINELPSPFAVRVYRLLPVTVRDEIFVHLSERSRKRIRRYLKFPAASAGALLDPNVDMLPAELSVSGAIRAIERYKSAVGCDIYVIDGAQRLVGMVDVGKLLKANRSLRLKDIMVRKTRSISAYAKVDTLLKHPGWSVRRSLPVVDRDNTLVGALAYLRVKDSLGDIEETAPPDAMASLLSFAGLYWFTVAQLIDSVFAITGVNKGGRS